MLLSIYRPARQAKHLSTAADTHSIWLADFANKTPNSSSIYLHGFDVSPAQFPPGNEISGPENRKIPLSVQDACRPYPPEHQGRYDLVHIRLLTAGLKQDDYGTVLKNARNLLSMTKNHRHSLQFVSANPPEPNGWIQWEEVDHTTFCTNKLPELPAITKLRNYIIDAMLKLNLWPFAPQRVYDEISTGGFQHIRRETYTTTGKEHLHGIAPKWVAGVMRALVPTSLVVNGQARNEEEAKAKVEVLIAEFEKHCEDGALPLVNYGVTVAQRCG